jgi:hypothetical protein
MQIKKQRAGLSQRRAGGFGGASGESAQASYCSNRAVRSGMLIIRQVAMAFRRGVRAGGLGGRRSSSRDLESPGSPLAAQPPLCCFGGSAHRPRCSLQPPLALVCYTLDEGCPNRAGIHTFLLNVFCCLPNLRPSPTLPHRSASHHRAFCPRVPSSAGYDCAASRLFIE